MQAFKKPIHREDLIPVILSGIFIAIVSGLLVGAIKLMIEETFALYLQLIFSVVLAYYTARRIKNSYQTYHILYSIITVITFVLAFYMMNVTYLVGFFFIRDVNVFTFEAFKVLFNPIYSFQFLDITASSFLTLDNLLELIFFLVGAIYAFMKSK